MKRVSFILSISRASGVGVESANLPQAMAENLVFNCIAMIREHI